MLKSLNSCICFAALVVFVCKYNKKKPFPFSSKKYLSESYRKSKCKCWDTVTLLRIYQISNCCKSIKNVWILFFPSHCLKDITIQKVVKKSAKYTIS